MRRILAAYRLLPLSLALVLVLPGLAKASQGQEVTGSGYLEQLKGPRQEGWLRRQIDQFRSFARLDRANRLLKEGKLSEARQELEGYLATAPKDYEARYDYLVILFKMKDYQGTIQQADLILQGHPRFVPALLYRGLARQALGHFDKAQQDFQAAAAQTQITPKDRRFALDMAADLALRLKNYALALSDLEQIKEPGADFNFSYRRGLALEGLGRLAEAEQAYHRALQQAGTDQERLRAYLALGELARQRQDWPAASLAFKAARDLEPDNPEVWWALAQVAYARKDYAASARYMDRMVTLQPTPQDRDFLINVLGLLPDYRQVTERLSRLLTEAPAPEERYRIYTELGQAYNKWGKFAEATWALQEAAKIKADLPTLEALAQTQERSGHLAQAIATYREALKCQTSPQIHLKLGTLLEKQGDYQGAVYQLEQATAGGGPGLRLTAYKQVGFIYYRLGNFAEAQRFLEKALALQPNNPELYQALAETALKLKAPAQALAYQKKAVELTSRPEAAGPGWERLGSMALQLGRYQEAIDYFQRALALEPSRSEIRQNLGIALFKLEKWPEALEQFQQALAGRRFPRTLVYVGLVYQKMNKPGLAIPYLEQALGEAARLTPAEHREVLSTLGYLYADEKEYARAARAWSQALALQPDPVVALDLAKMQRRLGQTQEALATLEGINPAQLPPVLRVERLDEMGANLQTEKQSAKALAALTQANQMEGTPDRDYRIGLIHQDERQAPAAIPFFQKATAQDPGNNKYKVALGYAYLNRRDYRDAARLFEEVLKNDPDYLKLYPDLAYCYMHEVKNDQAVTWFKRAIDNQPLYPVASEEEAERLHQELYRYRKEVSKLTNQYNFTAYLSYQTAKPSQSVAPGMLGGGAIPSQGGAEFAYTPPKIGFRDERIFQVFTRVLWNIKPGSMRFDEDSFQGGVGVRYKPLQTQNLYVWGERLFKMGDKSQNNWLLRLLYSWDYGYDLKPGKARWDYTFLYGDAAYFTNAPGTWAYYGEIRQGITFNFNDKVLLTPHLVADARYEDPHTTNSSYLEEGVGVSLKFLFWQTKYTIDKGSFELLAYYKHGNFLNRGFGVSGSKYDGFFLTGIFHF